MNNITITNSTIPIYSQVQKGFLPLSGLVLSPLICAIIYIYARRKPKNSQETVTSKLWALHSIIAGTFMGQFICHTFFKATIYSKLGFSIMSIFVLIGYFIMHIFDLGFRLFSESEFYVASGDSYVDYRDIEMDKKTMEKDDFASTENASSEEFAKNAFDLEDEQTDEAKRRSIFYIVYVVMIYIVILEGLFLVYDHPKVEAEYAVTITFFYINKVLQSIAIFGSMMHAKLHILRPFKKRIIRISILCLIWSAAIASSVIPVMADIPSQNIAAGVENGAVAAFYCIGGGIILWTALYFTTIKPRTIDRKKTIISILLFMGSSILSWVTALNISFS